MKIMEVRAKIKDIVHPFCTYLTSLLCKPYKRAKISL